MLYRVEGLVIRSTDYGEGNKIVTLLTESYGKVGVMARGAKKMNSRHSAATQLFTFGEFVFYRAGSGLGQLNHADMVTSHHKLREDVVLSAYAAYLAEMTDRMIADHERNPFLYHQLVRALDELEAGKNGQIISHIYEMKILGVAGYAPVLDTCACCGETSELATISARMGGALCQRCAPQDQEAIHTGVTVIKLLRLFQGVDLAQLGSISIKPETRVVLKKAMRSLLDTHLHVTFKSRQVLDQLEKLDF